MCSIIFNETTCSRCRTLIKSRTRQVTCLRLNMSNRELARSGKPPLKWGECNMNEDASSQITQLTYPARNLCLDCAELSDVMAEVENAMRDVWEAVDAMSEMGTETETEGEILEAEVQAMVSCSGTAAAVEVPVASGKAVADQSDAWSVTAVCNGGDGGHVVETDTCSLPKLRRVSAHSNLRRLSQESESTSARGLLVGNAAGSDAETDGRPKLWRAGALWSARA